MAKPRKRRPPLKRMNPSRKLIPKTVKWTEVKADGPAIVWIGERNRSLRLSRPCPCGCDSRGGRRGVGYLTGSNAAGEGFTVFIDDEKVFQAMSKLIPVHTIDLHGTEP